ncbi:helix-turn-helix domain-containing protein [Haloarcula salinisoli]|uniref:Helix-turn-helix domain-containing protein n=1 Tax=Haloarcula salinisoli TaxID=2487746 RepID=A0A8J7YIU8_9EURY|nr:helix-turn-helix domain-containing protein [Halomicroarcula salinisoli]MBX0304126.1 helix-turn-helix domain-containing protein [Halomicroarcula salinisoli]
MPRPIDGGVKHLQVTVHVDDDYAPEFFELLADSSTIAEARLVDWSMTADDQSTLLYTVDGDPTAVAERAADTPGIESVELSETTAGQTYVLVVMRPLETPLFGAIHRASTQAGLIVRKPIVYRDGTMAARVVGDASALQRALDTAPDGVDVQIDEIGRLQGQGDEPVASLSERQREAVTAALELGYYDQPRGATHEDVAAELGCAPPTASDHLQKAEANIVHAVLDQFGGGE